MKFTQNYNLKKPDYSDFAEIPDHFNGNFDIIDEKLKEYIDALIAHKAESVKQAGGVHGFIYEEGEWTPTLIADGGTGGVNNTYSEQYGYYIRKGNEVTVHFSITLTSKDPNLGNNPRIAGLPFVGLSTTPIGSIYWMNVEKRAEIESWSLRCRLDLGARIAFMNVGDNTNLITVQGHQIKANTVFRGSLTYYI